MRSKRSGNLAIAPDARGVWFGLQEADGEPYQFDVDRLQLHEAPQEPDHYLSAKTEHEPNLAVTGWINTETPRLNGRRLLIESAETARSLAIAPDSKSFILGAQWALYRFDDTGRLMWRTPTPGTGWGVALSADGSVLTAALGDGTIRWFEAETGRELLAFFVHNLPGKQKNWIAWTPSGYYATLPGGEDLLGWHLNGKTWNAPVEFFPASRLRDRFYRPDIVRLVLKTKDEARAIREANSAAKRMLEEEFARKDLPPVIELITDPRGIETDKSEIELHYRLRTPSGREVSKIEIRIDGALHAVTQRGFTQLEELTDGSVMRVAVPHRDSVISVVAFDGVHKSAAAALNVRWTGPLNESPKRSLHALLVGVSAYGDPKLALSYAHKDALDLARTLKTQEGRFFKSVSTEFLLDGEATEGSIQLALEDLAERGGPDDYYLVFMAGHGATRKNRFFFLPATARMESESLTANSLSGAQIRELLAAMPGRVLFFIDACYSAKALDIDVDGLINSVTGEENAVVMYTSSSSGEVSYERAELENGVFTEALMEILGDSKVYDDDGLIMTDVLGTELRKRVRRMTDKQQTPFYRPSGRAGVFPVAGL